MTSDHENKCTFISPTFKVEEYKVSLFFSQTSYYWDISFLWILNICPFVHYQITYHKTTKCLYLRYMMSDEKNKGTLFPSTLKVGKIKVHLFSWLEFILVSYGHLVVSWRYWKNSHKSQNDKKLLSPSNDVWSKK